MTKENWEKNIFKCEIIWVMNTGLRHSIRIEYPPTLAFNGGRETQGLVNKYHCNYLYVPLLFSLIHNGMKVMLQ